MNFSSLTTTSHAGNNHCHQVRLLLKNGIFTFIYHKLLYSNVLLNVLERFFESRDRWRIAEASRTINSLK
jgi:hypothetical protein